nr:MAG TPA: hypothetical protein [Caudoviricetes sp.]
MSVRITPYSGISTITFKDVNGHIKHPPYLKVIVFIQ